MTLTSQPPGPPDAPDQENNELSDESGIVEPPRDPDKDTKPLKPLHPRPSPEGSPAQGDIVPPATILQDATSGVSSRIQRWSLLIADTDRVRLVPKAADPPPWRVIMQLVKPSQTKIGLDVRQMLVVGRVDPESAHTPDLDLTPHMALEHGVSRQHAVLIPTADALCLVDLGSTNGTWVNGIYLEPGRRHELSANDRIEFGLLRLIVQAITPLNRALGHEA